MKAPLPRAVDGCQNCRSAFALVRTALTNLPSPFACFSPVLQASFGAVLLRQFVRHSRCFGVVLLRAPRKASVPRVRHCFVTVSCGACLRCFVAVLLCGAIEDERACRVESKRGTIYRLKYWEIIADRLSACGVEAACVAKCERSIGGRESSGTMLVLQSPGRYHRPRPG